MKTNSKMYPVDIFFEKSKEEKIFHANGFERVEYVFDEFCSQLVDVHEKQGVGIHYLRVTSEDGSTNVRFSSRGTVLNVFQGSDFGMLLTVGYENRTYSVWLPVACGQFRFDKYQRISAVEDSSLPYLWEFNSGIQLDLFLSGNPGERAIIPYMIIDNSHEQFIEEIKFLSKVERCLYRKTDWFFAQKPSDIWGYLINGSIYDPRSRKGIDKRFKCQQCAFAWWSYFGFLYKETGKKLYDIMQNFIAYSVLLDLSAKGEWGHGYWSDAIETHARFHLDGIHLLISQHEKTGEPLWVEAAERGMAFVTEHLMEQLDDGSLWFLHDTNEHREKHIHFQSTLFGKTPGNSLCINTHVQALTVLYRLVDTIPHNKIYSELFEKGVKALQRVLAHQPAETIYRMLMFVLMKSKTKRKPQSLLERAINGIVVRIIKKMYWAVRRQFPRLVFPGGFIERDLTLGCFVDNYQITNLKDFLTLYRQVPLPWLVPYIKNNLVFLRKFLSKWGLTNALDSSPYYIELEDVLYMYDKHIEKVNPEEMNTVKETIYLQAGGYSVDYYASELVRGK